MKKSQIFLIIMPILLYGCAIFGPDYKTPKVVTPNSWQESANNTNLLESNIDISTVAWWNKFNDKTLNRLMDNALENNNDIQTAIGNITVAAGSLQKVNMSWFPTVSLGGTYGTSNMFDNSNTINSPILHQFSSSVTPVNNVNFYSYGLIPSYSLNILQQIKQQDVAKSNLELAKANKDAVTLAIISQVSGGYFSLLAFTDQAQKQKQLIYNLEKLLQLVKIQYKYGLATQSDVDNWQFKLSQAKMQLPNIERNIVITKNALAILVNESSTINVNGDFDNTNLEGMIPVNLPSYVLKSRPDVIIAEKQVKIANDNIGVATANFFPHISLTTPVGGYNSQLGNLFTTTGNFWATQISATMPILNLGLYGLIKQSKGKYYIAYYNYIKTVHSAFADVNNNLSGYENIQNIVKEAKILYNSSNSSVILSNLNYKNGYTSYMESLSSNINLDNAKILLSQTKLQELQSIISLYQSLAAGYNYENSNKQKPFGDGHDL